MVTQSTIAPRYCQTIALSYRADLSSGFEVATIPDTAMAPRYHQTISEVNKSTGLEMRYSKDERIKRNNFFTQPSAESVF